MIITAFNVLPKNLLNSVEIQAPEKKEYLNKQTH